LLTSLFRVINPGAKAVPPGIDWDFIRTIVAVDETKMRGLDYRLRKGREWRKTCRQLYQEQRRLMDDVKTDYDEAVKSVYKMKKRRLKLEERLRTLRAVLPPNPRYPADILKLIFEYAVLLDESQFDCATAISHVSQHWREVALQTPKLWTEMYISTSSDPTNVEAFWERSVERLAKDTPPSITLEMTGLESEQEAVDALAFWKLDYIAELDIFLQKGSSATCLAELELQDTVVDSLSIICPEWAPSTDVLSFARMFRVVTLTISYPGFTTYTRNVAPLSLDILRLIVDSHSDRYETYSLTRLTQIFPTVLSVQLEDAKFVVDRDDEITWTNLQTLDVVYALDVPWDNMWIPNLTRLFVLDSFTGNGEDLISFINRHLALQHLVILGKSSCIPAILDSASHLKSLTVDYWDGIGNPSKLRHRNLREFVVLCYDYLRKEHVPLTTQAFDMVVQNRFIRPASASSNGNSSQTSVMLRILVHPTFEEKDLEWFGGKTATSALHNVTEATIRSDTYKSCNFEIFV
jgi:hypothetical protein